MLKGWWGIGLQNSFSYKTMRNNKDVVEAVRNEIKVQKALHVVLHLCLTYHKWDGKNSWVG